MNGPIVEGVASRYLADIFSSTAAAGTPRTAGATATTPLRPTRCCWAAHFPLLQEALQNVVGPQVRIVDSAATTALRVAKNSRPPTCYGEGNGPARYSFLTTDNTAALPAPAWLFLGRELGNGEVSLVDL